VDAARANRLKGKTVNDRKGGAGGAATRAPKPETPEWHAQRALFWRDEVARRERGLIETQAELSAARKALEQHRQKAARS
jgi:hypothetical protein